jgi:RHS repeat-associated protein
MRKFKNGSKSYEWEYTKYDALGRIISTGILFAYPSETRDQLQQLANSFNDCSEFLTPINFPDGNRYYYSNLAFPSINRSNSSFSTIQYYDSYYIYYKYGGDLIKKKIITESDLQFNLDASLYSMYKPDIEFTNGLKVIDIIHNFGLLLPTIKYYDIYDRLIQESSTNHTRGFDRYTHLYSGLTRNILKTEHSQKAILNNVTYNLTDKVDIKYDQVGRIIEEKYALGNHESTTISYNYNALGKLLSKSFKNNIGNSVSLNYDYNIRGWLTSINDLDKYPPNSNLFGINLYYNISDPILNNKPLFNGNITAAKWYTIQPTGMTSPIINGIKGYIYSYDELKRITKSTYGEIVGTNFIFNNRYTEEIIDKANNSSYDLNGNIKGIVRYGLISPNNIPSALDELKYHYYGNQVIAIDDKFTAAETNGNDFKDNGSYYNGSTPEYGYDSNGNLIMDRNKQIINISYDINSQPISIEFTNDSKISYSYNDLGKKCKQLVYTNGILKKQMDFIGNMVYQNGKPAWCNFKDSRIVFNADGTLQTENYLKDNLGNIRVSFLLDGNNTIINQANSFYPFGMNIKELCLNSTNNVYKNFPNKYLYNGKLLQDDLNLNWLDYGARMYDGTIGRWHKIDPLTEKYPSISPYCYVNNNPLNYIDNDGFEKDKPDPKPRIQFYIEIKGSFGPQIKYGFSYAGVTLDLVAQYKNVESTRRFNLDYDENTKKWGVNTTVGTKNQDYEVGWDLLSIVGGKLIKEYKITEHPAFAEKIDEVRSGFLKQIETSNCERSTSNEKVSVELAGFKASALFLLGFEITIGAEEIKDPISKNPFDKKVEDEFDEGNADSGN